MYIETGHFFVEMSSSDILVSIKDRFLFKNEDDIIWVISFIIGCISTLITYIIFFFIMIELYIIQKYDEDINYQVKSLNKILSTWMSIFCVLSQSLVFSSFPVCSVQYCGDNYIGNLYFIGIFNTYIVCKTFLYALFIWRLYNEKYKRIKTYSNKLKKCLIISLIVIIIVLIIFNITTVESILLLFGDNISQIRSHIITFCVVVSFFVDSIVSLITLYLFLRPLCYYYKRKQDDLTDNLVQPSSVYKSEYKRIKNYTMFSLYISILIMV